MLESALEAEMTEHLGYHKQSDRRTATSRRVAWDGF